jgi:hypothetical protein
VIDLHTHSLFSDGSEHPRRIAEQASALGLRAIALTDHDTTASHDEMAAACADLELELVNGVEVSLRDDAHQRADRDGVLGPINIHLLAYFCPVDPASALQRELADLRVDRRNRNLALVELLVSLGFTRLTYDYVVALSGTEESVGRPHFARAMSELHPEIVGEPGDATTMSIFADWLGQGGRAYIPKTSKTIEEFVRAGAHDGVVFSIAHPLVNYLTSSSRDQIASTMPAVLASLRDRGVLGVEAHYGGTDLATRQLMVSIARDVGMIPTGGSDFHGSYKADVALGTGRHGDLCVPDSVLDELKNARA